MISRILNTSPIRAIGMEAMIVVRSVLETLPEAVLAAVLKISVLIADKSIIVMIH